ncbi:hypothetical protein G7K_4089-t1 [Saitoella complicata NRRL Y-17804]|uniref:Thioesterase domain-containing protein n=2 Tax=Saitoella complicata (strain BCRC 22490 / CBS 7301 / JCM 7358 / NBRC 10748 / NRRL Y-17804) TaxID=698492 RepID=A0A0E9NJH6_SAICN|nr:hypothetical protein G7K_4089-t1 [Saitoella complicata NRRL Y-17804]
MAVLTILKYVFLLLQLLNLKNALFAWHIRFWSLGIHHILSYYVPALRPKAQILHSSSSSRLFDAYTYNSQATLGDIDFYLHKSNSTYAADLDCARFDFLMHHFRTFFSDPRFKGVYIPLAGISFVFKKQIDPFERYHINTRILTWDSKWLFLESRFVGLDGSVRAVGVSKYVFKKGRKTIPIQDVLSTSGLEVDVEGEKRREEKYKYAEALLGLDDLLEDQKENGAVEANGFSAEKIAEGVRGENGVAKRIVA